MKHEALTSSFKRTKRNTSKKILMCSLFAFHFSLFTLKAQTINTFAGNHVIGYSGNGGQATAAEFDVPVDVAFDKSGNLYIADRYNELVRKVNTSGIVSRIAGNGHAGYSGDGGPATAAEFNDDLGVLVDNIGNIYISDQFNSLIRIVNTSGIINTFAGNHTMGPGYSGDGGQATAAEINTPVFMALDSTGNFYFADGGNYVVRKVNTSGIISTVAGNGQSGYIGDGGPATTAELYSLEGVALDKSGEIFITDPAYNTIRKVNTSGVINTIAGFGYLGYSGDGGPATAAEMNQPCGIKVDAIGNIYFADEINNVIRMINTAGIINAIVGNGYLAGTNNGGYSGNGGPATSAELFLVSNFVFDASGNMFLADEGNAVVREVTGLTTGFKYSDVAGVQILVYPNPNDGKFTLQCPMVNGEWSVDVYNITGQKILTGIVNQTPEGIPDEINISNQPDGLYILFIHINNQVFCKKIIITNN